MRNGIQNSGGMNSVIDEETGKIKYKKVRKLIGLRRLLKYERVSSYSASSEEEQTLI